MWYNCSPMWGKLSVILIFIFSVFIFVSTNNESNSYDDSLLGQVSLISPYPTSAPAPTLSPDKLLSEVQAWRENTGKKQYQPSEFLCSIADKRIVQIQTEFSHRIFLETKYCLGCYLAENLASGLYPEEKTLSGWLASPTHLDNLEKNYTHTCIRTEKNYAVQTFGYY